ncbi:Transcriptional regulator AbrB [Planktothrix tepida]|uniref:Transcriptional regulator AbrB n=2 Tax=Planktothrix TaxID=54304 RepID=A0A1J1LWA5_9CYAN|nr:MULTISPECIES: AbrB family transcriptional regulator [Planktothrix]CAD5931385.1 Transcriptional regulator AbrB [Planktothrix pseudagardhii]CAD5977860.1 Transcriptional regulator AbrB [Planktothrix tepida]CUR36025.1 Transcriptional regulator AbrB [Planktothrix tepida PCC 9214]
MAKTITEKPSTTPLTGKALLQKVKALGNLPRREAARLCGYYTQTKDSQTRANMTEFYDALLAAKGIALDPGRTKDGRGREASFRACVHKNGSLVIGANYTESMGLEAGDQFEIRLGSKHIHLIQVGEKSEEDVLDEE